MKNNLITLEERTKKIMEEYVLIPYTRSSRSFSIIRRMKAEKELNVPIDKRASFIVSVKAGQRANEMTEIEWEEFYDALSNEFKTDYPDMYNRLFSVSEKFCSRCGNKNKEHYSGGWISSYILHRKQT